MSLHVISHPLVLHKISMMRDINTGSKEFRELVSEIAMLICYEATKDLPLKEVEIETPVALAKTKVLDDRKIAFVPVLRAGLGMVDALIKLVPNAKVGHIGMFRDAVSHKPVKYYSKMPDDIAERDVILLDPMLATGYTAIESINELKNNYCVKNIKFMCIISCPEGISALQSVHPDVDIYTGIIDEKLNENMYIVPGVGDAGDRIFGTK